jgi:hypothetical protein
MGYQFVFLSKNHNSSAEESQSLLRRSSVAFAALAAVFIIYAYARTTFSEFMRVQYDDSFITFRYADNLVNGLGMRFNPGDSSNSASSLLYVLLLSFGHVLTGVDFPELANALNLAGIALFCGSVTRIAAMRSTSIQGFAIAVGCGVLFSIFPPLVYWTFSGMETTLFLGLGALTLSMAIGQLPRDDRGTAINWRFVTMLGLLSLTRVEGTVIAVTCALVLGALSGRPANITQFIRSRYVLYALTPVVIQTLQLLFYWLYYDSPISDPIRFKDIVNYYERSTREAWASYVDFMKGNLLPFLLLVCVGLIIILYRHLRHREHLRWYFDLVPGLAVLVAISLFLLRSPYSDERRYELTTLIPVAVLVGVVVGELVHFLQQVGNRFLKILGTLMILGGVVLIANESMDLTAGIHSRVDTYMYVQQARVDAAQWLQQNSEAGSVVMSSDIGALSFYNSSNVYLDVAGLVNREQISAVLERKDVYLTMKKRQPQYLVDTIGPDGVSGVEQILSNPSNYYTPTARTWTSCARNPVVSKEVLATFPDIAPAGLRVQISKITWDVC